MQKQDNRKTVVINAGYRHSESVKTYDSGLEEANYGGGVRIDSQR